MYVKAYGDGDRDERPSLLNLFVSGKKGFKTLWPMF